MTIDPDDYDPEELRRIADEQLDARSADDAQSDDHSSDERRASGERSGDARRSSRPSTERRHRGRTDRRRIDDRADDGAERRERRGGRDGRNGERRRRGRAEDRSDERRRNGRVDDQRDEGRAGNGRADERRAGERRPAERRGRDSGDARVDVDERDADEVTVRPRNEVSRPRRGESDHANGHDEVVRADRIARDLGFGGDADAGLGDDGRSSEQERARSDTRSRRDGRRSRVEERARERPRRTASDSGDVGRFQFDTEVRERPRGRAGEALRNNQLEQLLVHETAAAGDGLSKPYLTALPDEYVAERTVFDWLEFLVLKGGFKRTMDALRYYHTVEWLTEGVEAELQDYLVGFSGEVSNTEEFDVDDHHLSLVYIARLASMT